jgi:hypothetical protein
MSVLGARQLEWVATTTFLIAACADGPPGEVATSAGDSPDSPGIEFPYRVEPACPGEGCSYGLWLACDSVPLFAGPGDSSPTGQYLLPDQAFEVTSGAVVVETPGIVAVTRPTPQAPYLADAVTFVPGDTLYVLDYLGEGFFNAWHRGALLEVEAFWPWENFYPAAGFEFGGELIQAGRTSFWAKTSSGLSGTWISVDDASVAVPNALDPDPPTCR